VLLEVRFLERAPSLLSLSLANELARYIVHALAEPPQSSSLKETAENALPSTPNRPRKHLSLELVAKIGDWVVEKSVDGRAFLRGGEGQWA
jgi:hypothetical protein